MEPRSIAIADSHCGTKPSEVHYVYTPPVNHLFSLVDMLIPDYKYETIWGAVVRMQAKQSDPDYKYISSVLQADTYFSFIKCFNQTVEYDWLCIQ
jgi:hypothetical protein